MITHITGTIIHDDRDITLPDRRRHEASSRQKQSGPARSESSNMCAFICCVK
jgi:hypothetical protein